MPIFLTEYDEGTDFTATDYDYDATFADATMMDEAAVPAAAIPVAEPTVGGAGGDKAMEGGPPGSCPVFTGTLVAFSIVEALIYFSIGIALIIVSGNGPDDKSNFIKQSYEAMGLSPAVFIIPAVLLILAAVMLCGRAALIISAFQSQTPVGLWEDTKERLQDDALTAAAAGAAPAAGGAGAASAVDPLAVDALGGTEYDVTDYGATDYGATDYDATDWGTEATYAE